MAGSCLRDLRRGPDADDGGALTLAQRVPAGRRFVVEAVVDRNGDSPGLEGAVFEQPVVHGAVFFDGHFDEISARAGFRFVVRQPGDGFGSILGRSERDQSYHQHDRERDHFLHHEISHLFMATWGAAGLVKRSR